MSGDYKFDTLSLHAGHVPDPIHGSRAVPIHQTTSYVFKDCEHAASLYNMELGGHLYTRISNPTIAVLEQRVAALDGGVAATATASGMAAVTTAIMTICSSGDHIVASSRMYGANINLLENTLPRFGIKTTFVAPDDLAAIEAAIQSNTKIVFGEVIGNPGLDVMDVEAVAKITAKAGVPLMLDCTFNTPWMLKANDLVFRKTLRDNGAAVRNLLNEINSDMDDVANASENLAEIATTMKEATKIAEAALDALLARANSPRDAASAGVDFTMMLGYLAGGWQMARAGAAASRALASGEGAPDFMRAKQGTTSAYMAYCLPEVDKLAAKMRHGPEALAAINPDWL